MFFEDIYIVLFGLLLLIEIGKQFRTEVIPFKIVDKGNVMFLCLFCREYLEVIQLVLMPLKFIVRWLHGLLLFLLFEVGNALLSCWLWNNKPQFPD